MTNTKKRFLQDIDDGDEDDPIIVELDKYPNINKLVNDKPTQKKFKSRQYSPINLADSFEEYKSVENYFKQRAKEQATINSVENLIKQKEDELESIINKKDPVPFSLVDLNIYDDDEDERKLLEDDDISLPKLSVGEESMLNFSERD